jgi:membrane-associated phospholipid phosphatase
MPFALLGLAIAWGVMLLFGAMEFDRGLLIFAYAGDVPRLAEAARWLTMLGGGREWRTALLLAAITLSGRLLVDLQKDWTARVRPDAQGHLVPVDTLAFPSGHAANAAMVWLCLALLLPRTPRGRFHAVWAAVWLTVAVGISRVMLGVHWASDVIGGWAFGLFWTLLLLRLSRLPVAEGTPPPLAHSSPKGE